MAIRYDQKTKDEVLAFIEQYNASNKRGGQSAAAGKYKISALTISNWMKKAGVKKSGKKGKAPKAAKVAKAGRGKGRGRKSAATPSSLGATLERMVAIRGEIESLQAEFEKLKNSL